MPGPKLLVWQPPTALQQRRLLIACKATVGQRTLPSAAPSDRSRLHDPACIGASLSTSTSVQAREQQRLVFVL